MILNVLRLPPAIHKVQTKIDYYVNMLQLNHLLFSIFPVIYVPIIPIVGVHTLPRHMSQRHKTPKPAVGPRNGRPQAVRLRQRQAPRQGRAERLVHLQSLLQGARAHIRRHRLHDQDRRVERRLRAGGAAARPAHIPRRFGRRSAGRDHQGARHADPGANQRDESQLYGIQVSADQVASLAAGETFMFVGGILVFYFLFCG